MKDKWRDRSKDMAMPENNETNNLNVDDASDNPYLNQKSKKKMSKPKKVILTIVLVIVAIFIVLIIAAANTPTIPDDISGMWHAHNLYIVFHDGQYEIYTFKDNAVESGQMGDYTFNKNNSGKLTLKGDGAFYAKIDTSDYELTYNKGLKKKRSYDILSYENGKEFTVDLNDGKKSTFKYVKEKQYQTLKKQIKTYLDKYNNALKEEQAKYTPKEVTVSTGNHICGSDFNPRTYNISLVSGSGNVSCLDSGLNEIFGTEDSDYVQSYKNAVFSEGDVLEISGNVTIKLTPAE